MIGEQANLTIGHIKRHVPPGSRLGDAVALMDIAQDFLLAHLHERSVFDLVTFKGGTALRKLFAGPSGRFSTDIDLAAADMHDDQKIARLTRRATARDAADLVWVASTSPHSQFDRDLTRHLAVLKIWVDNHGLGPAWSAALNPAPLNPDAWLTPRKHWDDEQIGLLTHPPPPLKQLEKDLFAHYQWLRDLTDAQQRLGQANASDRTAALRHLREIMSDRLDGEGLY